MSKKIFCMINDDKTQNLKEAGIKQDLDISVSPFMSVFFPFFLALSIVRGDKPDAIIVRYLNDKKQFILSLLFFLSRRLTFSMSKLFNVKIIWFCHNVDKETVEHFPKLIKKNREYLCKHSEKIFVMDKLLIPLANNEFPECEEKIDYINFGIRKSNYRRIQSAEGDELIDVLKDIKEDNGKNTYIGFCPTNYGKKYLHIDYSVI